jgi:hypothetical protein
LSLREGEGQTPSAIDCTPPEEFEVEVEDDGTLPPEDEVTSQCPSTLSGKVLTTMIPVAGENHVFEFDGPMIRKQLLANGNGWYGIRETISNSNMWVAIRGDVLAMCRGVCMPLRQGVRLWVGVASSIDVRNMEYIMGPGFMQLGHGAGAVIH